MSHKSLKFVLQNARQLVRDLERLTVRRPLDQAVLEELADDGLTTSQVALRVRRRRGDVAAMLRALEGAGRIKRAGTLWELTL